MLKQKTYIAIQDFNIPLGSNDQISVKRGDEIKFDGLTVVVGINEVKNRALNSVIGDWIIEKDKCTDNNINVVKTMEYTTSRNATGRRIVESSDPGQEIRPRTGYRKSDDLSTLLDEYEKGHSTVVEDSEKDILKTVRADKKYEIYEDQEVKKVVNKNSGKDEGKSKNKVVQDSVAVKEKVKEVKETAHKKLKVDKEMLGKVVKETNFKEKETKKDKGKRDKKDKKVVSNEVKVKDVKEKAVNQGEVRTSTSHMVQSGRQVKVDDPFEDAVVVSKVSSDIEDREIVEDTGIVSELKVGKNVNNDIIIDDVSIIGNDEDVFEDEDLKLW